MTSQGQLGRSGDRSSWLDVLRGLAIFGVVSVHSIQTVDSFPWKDKSESFSWVMGLGKYGVELFFFLSGWLLASIYGMNSQPISKSYWVRRAGRIYPLWLLFLVIGFARWKFTLSGKLDSPMNPVVGEPNLFHSTAGVVFLSISFTLFLSASLWNSVIPGSWSIQAEVGHYLLFPLIRTRSLNQVLTICTVTNLSTSALSFFRPRIENLSAPILNLIDAYLRLGLYSTIGYFLLGILGFKALSEYRKKQVKNFSLNDFGVSRNIMILYSISILLIPCHFGNQIEAIVYLFLMLAIGSGILLNKTLSTFFEFLGKHSYFVYFMHFLILEPLVSTSNSLHLILAKLGSQVVAFLMIFCYVLTLSALLAVPSMKFFEYPIMKFASKMK